MSGLFALLALQAASTAAPAPTPLDAALRCRAYAPLASVFLAPDDHRRFSDHWLKRTEELGRADGLGTDAVSMRTLVIPIKADDAESTLAACLEQWGKTLPARR